MSIPPFDLSELEQLIDAVREERIEAEQVKRLEQILGGHADARRYYQRAMRLQGYLEQNAALPTAEHGSEMIETSLARPFTAEAKTARSGKRVAWFGAAAALAACLVLAAWFVGPKLWRNGERNGPGGRTVALSPAWKIEATGAADYSIVDATSVRLDRGELRVASVGDKPAPTLLVRTPAGDVSASGTKFLIGYHRTPKQLKGERPMKSLVRVFVLSGVVTLANAGGSITGGSNELLAANEKSAPTKQVVQANSDFAVDLYRQLAKENTGENMFFSPYSVSIALAMTAEGARGETAQEMGRVLRWPEAMRRTGNDDQQIPWETSKVHSGLAFLNRMLDQQQDTPEKRAIRQQLASLQQALETQKERNKQLRGKDFRAYQSGMKKEQQIVNQLNQLIGQVDQYELSIANALWGEQTYPFDPAFVKTITGAYDTGAVRMVDFIQNFEQQRLLINGWVEDQTKERINNLLPEGSLDSLTRMVLANAIFFKGDWKSPFEKSQTKEQDFTLADGSTVKVPLMRNNAMESARYGAFTVDGALFDTPKVIDRRKPQALLYPDTNGFAMVELPYRGDDLAMVVIAPNKANGLEKLERLLSSETLNRWIEQLQRRKVNVFLPKFKTETSYSLVETLTAMGMGSAFDLRRADFSGMTSSGSKDLYISGVFHKAFVDVNEQGTEAAAATAVAIGLRSAPITRPFTPTFRADRPFIYLIRDTRSGSILFLGRMLQP